MRAQANSTEAATPLHLPEVLAEIAAATSFAVAMKVAAEVGGTRVYIPSRPAAGHWLSALVGHDQALKIGAALAPSQTGLFFIIPLGPFGSRVSRWRRMKELIDSNLTKREIARAIGCHERTVQFHRSGALKRVARTLSQLTLFD